MRPRGVSRRWLLVVLLAALILAGAARANRIQDENALPGTSPFAHALATGRLIEGYASEISLLPGEQLHLHVSAAPSARYRVELYRFGWYGGALGRLLGCVPSCDSDEPAAEEAIPPPESTGRVVAGWPQTDTIPIPPDAVSGYYAAELVLTTGAGAGTAAIVPFVVRQPIAETPSALLVQVPVNTWQAYNPWGGYSFYNFQSIGDQQASHISFDRPYASAVGTQTMGEWELALARFLEREGYDVSYQADSDTDADEGSLLRHRLIVTAGHGEYWTRRQRDAFDAARTAGTNLAFMGANTGYWQVRYEDGGRTLVGYKSYADPVPDLLDKTNLFRAIERHECALLGVQHQGALAPPGPLPDYRVNPDALADPWFADTGLAADSVIARVVGPEWDQVPFFEPTPCLEQKKLILFQYPGPPGPAHAVKYVAPSGARVFASGSLAFVQALDDARGFRSVPVDARLQQFVRNMLDDMRRPAALRVFRSLLKRDGVLLRVGPRRDPRVTSIVVKRREGTAAYPIEDATATVVCVLAPQPDVNMACRDRPPGHRTYVYEGVTTDRWGSSQPAIAEPLTVPNSEPAVELLAPARAYGGRRIRLRARATDADGDTLRYRWFLNGRAVGRSHTVVVRAGSRGAMLVVVLRVADGHGATAFARADVSIG